MFNKETFLCIIPARGGSKGIPDKNIINLNGNPLIYYSIMAAKRSNIFDRIIVSTDSKKISDVCEKYDVDIPFLRPDYLATDDSRIEDTISYTLKYIEESDKKYDYICLLQPTSPLIKENDILNATNMLKNKNTDMIVSVGENPIKYEWIISLTDDLSMKNFSNKVCGTNKQCFKKTYFLNGAIYLGKWDIFYNKKDYYSQNTYAYIMPYERSIDIDTYSDLNLVQLIMEKECQIK